MQSILRRESYAAAARKFVFAVMWTATLMAGLLVDIRIPRDAPILFDGTLTRQYEMADARTGIAPGAQSSSIA